MKDVCFLKAVLVFHILHYLNFSAQTKESSLSMLRTTMDCLVSKKTLTAAPRGHHSKVKIQFTFVNRHRALPYLDSVLKWSSALCLSVASLSLKLLSLSLLFVTEGPVILPWKDWFLSLPLFFWCLCTFLSWTRPRMPPSPGFHSGCPVDSVQA